MKVSDLYRTATVQLCLLCAVGLAACGGGGDSASVGGGQGAVAAAVPAPVLPVVPKAWGVAEKIGVNRNASPTVKFDASGNAIAVWLQDFGLGTPFEVVSSRYTPGVGWGGVPRISAPNGEASGQPQIAFDASGNALAVWSAKTATKFNIWASRYTAGVGWGAAALIETDDAGDAADPQIAVDASGNALAVWSQFDGTRFNIVSNRYTVGVGWGTAATIETDNLGNAFFSKIAMDASGNALAVWQQAKGAANDFNLVANRYTVGSGWGTAELIETGAESVGNKNIKFDSSGNALAVWNQGNGGGGGGQNNIFSNRYTAGVGWGVAVRLDTNNTGTAQEVQIAIDTSGNAIAVWTQYDGVNFNIAANRYTAGVGWGTAGLIETANGGDASEPQIAIDASGNALAVWSQSDGTRKNILANRYTVGVGWGNPSLIETDNAGDAKTPQIAIDANGNALAVWSQSDGALDKIWANAFRSSP